MPDLNRNKEEKDTVIKKSNSPSPHTYDNIENYHKIRLRSQFNIKLAKAKDVKFMDIHVKSKKWIPGVGNYEGSDKPWLLCSRDISIPKYRR